MIFLISADRQTDDSKLRGMSKVERGDAVDWQAWLFLILFNILSMQLPCVVGWCLDTYENWPGWMVHLGDLVTGTNKHHQDWLQYRERNHGYLNTLWDSGHGMTEDRQLCWELGKMGCWKHVSVSPSKVCSPVSPTLCPYSKSEQMTDTDRLPKESKEAES